MSKWENLEDKLRRAQSSEATLAHDIEDVQIERDKLRAENERLRAENDRQYAEIRQLRPMVSVKIPPRDSDDLRADVKHSRNQLNAALERARGYEAERDELRAKLEAVRASECPRCKLVEENRLRLAEKHEGETAEQFWSEVEAATQGGGDGVPDDFDPLKELSDEEARAYIPIAKEEIDEALAECKKAADVLAEEQRRSCGIDPRLRFKGGGRRK
ncbi:MAG: hypothetical protein ACYTBJ_00495 [Planctomycetota bacterium]|jgi:seryl-tRNA synthetase